MTFSSSVKVMGSLYVFVVFVMLFIIGLGRFDDRSANMFAKVSVTSF